MTSPADLMSARDATDADRLRDLLRRIDAKEVPVKIVKPPEWCGYPEYEVEGWKLCVFDDCGEWDYFEWVETPGGQRHETYDPKFHEHADLALGLERPPECVACVAETYRPRHDGDWGYESI